MAKKPRTPDPPRKVQAPKVRQRQASGGTVALPSTNTMLWVALAVLVVLAVVLIVLVVGGKGKAADVGAADVTKVRAAMVAAGCTFTQRPAGAASRHMSSADQRVRYATFPPASGIHNPSPAAWGNYRTPADPRQAVHNLEHGGVVVWYGSKITPTNRGALDRFWGDDPTGLLITPVSDTYPGVIYPKHPPIGSRIALTAWSAPRANPDAGTAYVAICPGFSESAFTTFHNTFVGEGPERIPRSALRP